MEKREKRLADGGVIGEEDMAKSAPVDAPKSAEEAAATATQSVSPVQRVIKSLINAPIKLNIHPGQVGLTYQKRFADGGTVEKENANEPKAPVGPSDEEKRKLVMKALEDKEIKMADGGPVPDAPLSPDAPQESKLQTILNALGMAGKQVLGPLAPLAAPARAAQALAANPATENAVKNVGVSMANGLGADIPTPKPPPVAPSAADVPPAAEPMPVPPPAAPMSPAPAAPGAGAPDPMAQLGKFDPSTVTPGLNPQDRQALAANLNQNQHTFGNYLAEAVAGIGDAVAAKGGVQQNSLGNIFALQTQQRQEALDNFDKARQAAVEHFTMKNQADQALINNLKARGELQVSPGIAAALGHPELANRPVAQADLVLKTDAMKYDYANKMTERKQAALKNSADEVDKALTHGGMFGTQKMMDAKSRLNMIHAQAIKNDPEAFGYSVSQVK